MSDQLSNLVESLRKHVEETPQEELEKEFERITHTKFYERWTDKMHSIGPEKRSRLIEAAIKKYSSEKYKKKEYALGYEPREELYTLFQKYAERFGEEYDDPKETSSFLASSLVIDGTWVVKLYIGQGAIIKMSRKEE